MTTEEVKRVGEYLEGVGIGVKDGQVHRADLERALDAVRALLTDEEAVIVANAKRSKLTTLVDENLECLGAGLKDSGFKVLTIKKGTPDAEVMELAEGAAILTKNSKDFLGKAVRYDFDVISVENIKFIDDLPSASNHTVTKIAVAIRGSGFAHLRGNFNLVVKDDGTYRLDTLV